MPTGADSGLVVLDVDLRHNRFAHPGAAVRNSAGHLPRGLDIRGDGGHVIVLPSLHASGCLTSGRREGIGAGPRLDPRPRPRSSSCAASIDFAYREQRVSHLYARIGTRGPFLALYIDCASRVSLLAGTDQEDATEIQRLVGSRLPLLGLHSAIEIARVGGEVRPPDWTGVLCVFSQ